MKYIKTFEQFINESNEAEVINEGFSVSDTAEKIFQDIDKKYKYKQLSADTYEEIKAALLALPLDRNHKWDNITGSKSFNKKLEKEYSGYRADTRFYFDGDSIICILRRQPKRNNYVDFEYYDGTEFRGWGGGDEETYFMKLYPKLFTEKIYHIYHYEDEHRGYGYGGTITYVKAKTREEAYAKAKGSSYYSAGIDEVDPKNIPSIIANWEEQIKTAQAALKTLKNL